MVRTGTLRRWAVVVGVVVLLAAIPVVVGRWPVRAAAIDPARLRGLIAASAGRPHHGFAQSNGLLPLPSLPNLGQVTALVSGTTQMRTWYAGPDRWRLDVINGGSERDLYRTPGAEYVWDFDDNRLTRIVGEQSLRLPRAADLTPPELVHRLLALTAGDRFEALAGRRIAGLTAAGLRVVPVTTGTTVDHVDIWADPASGLPVQVEVTAKGGERPVFVSRFLELHLDTPDAAVLTPPAQRAGIGFDVTEAPDILGVLSRRRFGVLPPVLAGQRREEGFDGQSWANYRVSIDEGTLAVGVYGTGLARFVVLPVPGRFGGAAYDDAAKFGKNLTLPGGRAALLGTGLLSVLVVESDQTYLVAGLVEPAVLEQVAADLGGVAR